MISTAQPPLVLQELDDDAAYMTLASSNNQGELSPLEIGLHALHCETLASGGRGQKGGTESEKSHGRSLGLVLKSVAAYLRPAMIVSPFPAGPSPHRL